MEWTFLLKYSGIQRLFVIFLLLSTYKKCEGVEECDFVKCATDVEVVIHSLRNTGTNLVCKNLFNSPWCSQHCMHQYFPNIPSDAYINQYSFTHYCNQNISSRDANWSCIARHGFQLLTCLANVSSLTTNNSHEDMKLAESCRKFSEFQKCPIEVLLPECGENSVEVVEDILQFILNNFMRPSCKRTVLKKAFSMQVYYEFGYEFKRAAISMDHYYNLIKDCFGRIQEEYDLNEFMCGNYEDAFTACVSYILSERGKSFPHVKTLFQKIFSLGGIKCKQSMEEQGPSLQTKSFPDSKTDLKDHNVLKDANEGFSYIPETSTPEDFLKSNEAFYHKVSTEKSINITHVKSITKKINQRVLKKDFSEKKISDSHEMNSENSTTYNTINYLKTSGAFNLHYDEVLLFFLLLFWFA